MAVSAYDNVGNRLAMTSTLGAVPGGTFSYDNNDRLAIDTYDANGNTISSGGISYVYDFENRLLMRGAVAIVYDGDGNRVSETVGGTTTKYLVDTLNPTGYSQVMDEIVNGSVTRTYAYGLQRISEDQLVSGSWVPSFYGYDGHGNVRFLTNSAGAVTDSYTYDAFGMPITTTGTTPNNFLYSGEWLDPNLSFYNLRARYYNQATGRFWTMDSLQQKSCCGSGNCSAWSHHPYTYADDDPVDRIDPSGQQAFEETAINYQPVLLFILTSGTVYYLGVALKSELDCDAKYMACLFNPWQPDWNVPNFGRRKPCWDCWRICEREGYWDKDKCPE